MHSTEVNSKHRLTQRKLFTGLVALRGHSSPAKGPGTYCQFPDIENVTMYCIHCKGMNS